jgi:hypothetical protein
LEVQRWQTRQKTYCKHAMCEKTFWMPFGS